MEKLLKLFGLPSPTVLLGVVCAILLSLAVGTGGGAYLGYEYRDGKVATETLAAANAAADRARKDAATELTAALSVAKTAAARRVAAASRRNKVEQVLSHDETAHTCRVSDDTFSVLLDSIRAANGATPPAGAVDAAVPRLPPAGQSLGSGLGAGLDGWRGKLWRLPPGETKPD